MSPGWLVALKSLEQEARQQRIRFFCWITGEQSWATDASWLIQDSLQKESTLVVSDQHKWDGCQVVSAHHLSRFLGQEFSLVIFDGFAGINPDALGQISGTIKGGGFLLFLTPPPDSQQFFQDPEKQRLCVEPLDVNQVGNQFLQFFANGLQHSRYLCRIDQQTGWRAPEIVHRAVTSPLPGVVEQQCLIEQLVVRLQTPQPFCGVVLAPRGRGKSVALGTVANHLLTSGLRIAVTAPRKAALVNLFASLEVPSRITYCSAAELIANTDRWDLILVDEAAGLPVSVLHRLSELSPRVLFATTTEGYEGTGQGFRLRFLTALQARYSHCVIYELCHPIRWADPDPLEQLLGQVLLLRPISSPVVLTASASASVHIIQVSQTTLVAHPDYLQQLFSLLVEAHYRTTPGDLRILLDSPNQFIWLAIQQRQVVGACLVAREGELKESLTTAVWQGVRRPRGHLIPQLLVAQEGFQAAGGLSALRIVRIAVAHPFRRRGVAAGLLQRLVSWGQSARVDLLGAAFALTPELADFWQQQGFEPVRMGAQQDPVSGSYSVLLTRALSPKAKVQQAGWMGEYRQKLPYLARGWLQQAELLLLPGRVGADTGKCMVDRYEDLQGFAFHHRTYVSVAYSFACLANAYPGWENVLPAKTVVLINTRVLAQQSEAALLATGDYRGKKALNFALRQAAQAFCRFLEQREFF